MTTPAFATESLPPHCWRSIGSWGDSSCARLKDMLLCHNCDVYIQSGRNRLDQPLADDYRQQWAEIIARPKEEEPTNTVSVVIFRIGTQWLALPTTIFKRISEPQPIHRLPHRSNQILMGIVPVQGELHLAFSLKHLISPGEVGARMLPQRAFPRMVTIEKEGERWVFTVDEMFKLYELLPESAMTLEPIAGETGPSYLVSMFEVEGRLVHLIDEELLFAGLKRSLL